MCPGRAPKPGATARSAQFERQETGSTVGEIPSALILMQRARAAGPARETLKVLPRHNGFTVKSASSAIGPTRRICTKTSSAACPGFRAVPAPARSRAACIAIPRSDPLPLHTAERTQGHLARRASGVAYIYMCVMPYGSVHEVHALCLPTVDRGRPFIVERTLLRVLSGEWTAPEVIQHITRRGRDGTAQGDLTVSRLAVTRLKYHPVPVRTVARTRFANRLVSTMRDAENLRKCLPNHNSGHLRGPRAGGFFCFAGAQTGFFCVLCPQERGNLVLGIQIDA